MKRASFKHKYYVRDRTHAAAASARQGKNAVKGTGEEAESSSNEEESVASASTACVVAPVSQKRSAASAIRDVAVNVCRKEATESASEEESDGSSTTESATSTGKESQKEVAARDWPEQGEACANPEEAMVRAGEGKPAARSEEEDDATGDSEDAGDVAVAGRDEAVGCHINNEARGIRDKSKGHSNEETPTSVAPQPPGQTGEKVHRVDGSRAPKDIYDSEPYNPVFEDVGESHFWVRPFESGSALLCVDPRERSFICGLSSERVGDLEGFFRDYFFWDPTWLLSGGIHEGHLEEADSECDLFSFDDIHPDTIPPCAGDDAPDVSMENDDAGVEHSEAADIEVPYEFDTLVHVCADGEVEGMKKCASVDNVGNGDVGGDALCDIECRVDVERNTRTTRKAKRQWAAHKDTQLQYRLVASVDDFGSTQNRFRFQGKDRHAIAATQFLVAQGMEGFDPGHTGPCQRSRSSHARPGEYKEAIELLSKRHQHFLLELALLPAELKRKLRDGLYNVTLRRTRKKNTGDTTTRKIDDSATIASPQVRSIQRRPRAGPQVERPRVRSRRQFRSKVRRPYTNVEAKESTTRLSYTNAQRDPKETEVKESKVRLPYSTAQAELREMEAKIPGTAPAACGMDGNTATPSAGSSVKSHIPQTVAPNIPCHLPTMSPIAPPAKEIGRDDDVFKPPSTTTTTNTLIPSDAKATASHTLPAKRTKRLTSKAHKRSYSRATTTSNTNVAAAEDDGRDDKLPDFRPSENDPSPPKRFLAAAPDIDTSLPATVRERSLSHRDRRTARSPSPNIRQKYSRRRRASRSSYRRGRLSRSRSPRRGRPRTRSRRRSPNGRRDYDSRRGFRR
eukprot:GEMP01008497.1.p1 GENE.GEMP01008497.1~~GEMP01008497.1.p1  ORF type:complete len:851 (+),score=202.05 GEMP01008497.1:61-2613(+)